MKEDYRFSDLKSIGRKTMGLMEVAIFTVMYAFIWKDFYRELSTYAFYGRGRFVVVGLYAFLCLFFIIQAEGTEFGNRKKVEIVMAQTISVFLVNIITYIQLCLMSAAFLPIHGMLLLFALEIISIVIFSVIFTKIYNVFFATPWHMLMIYGDDNAFNVMEKLETRKDKYSIEKAVSIDVGYQKITEEIMNYNAILLSDVPGSLRNDILKFCYLKNIRAYVVPKISDILVRGGKNIDLFDMPLLMIKSGGFTHGQRVMKRLVDIVLTSIALIPGSIIMLIIAIAIKLEDGGPVFFKQMRMTRGLNEFNIIKFRSMIVDAEKPGVAIKATDDDDRVTKVGKYIRPTRLDELPQLFNILKGDMSIVGPRPERLENVREYMEDIPEFRFRTKVKAGLTGYAQVYGKYNTTPYDKLRLDLMYIENYSLLLDFKLIFMTLQILFKKESTEGFKKSPEEGEQ